MKWKAQLVSRKLRLLLVMALILSPLATTVSPAAAGWGFRTSPSDCSSAYYYDWAHQVGSDYRHSILANVNEFDTVWQCGVLARTVGIFEASNGQWVLQASDHKSSSSSASAYASYYTDCTSWYQYCGNFLTGHWDYSDFHGPLHPDYHVGSPYLPFALFQSA